MGNKIINITPGAPYSEPIKYNDIIESIRPMETDEVLKTLLVTANNAREISEDLNAILSSIRSGKGAVGTLLMDKQFADNLRQMMNNLNKGTSGFESTMDNVKKGTEAFNENMEAAKHSILFRGYFKKKEKKEAEKEMTEEEIEKESKRIDNAQARQRERNDRK